MIGRRGARTPPNWRIIAWFCPGLSGATGEDRFGWAVSVAGRKALVGDYSNDTAYVFGRSAGSWALKQTYQANTTDAHQYFGETVATDGETLLVGAPHAEVDGSVGAVYSLEPPAGSADPQGTYFTAPEPSAQFGGALATEGGTTVLTGRDAGDGYVYIYER